MNYKVQTINDFAVGILDDKINNGNYVVSENSIDCLFIDGKINTVEMLLEGYWKKVVFTIDKDMRADGIPMLVLPNEDDIEKIFKNHFDIGENEPFPQSQGDRNIIDYFKEGYKVKVAQGDRKWSDVDMIKAVVAHNKYCSTLKNGVPNFSEWLYNEGKYFYQSLQKKKYPESIELTMIVDENDERNWYVDVPSGKYSYDERIPPSKDNLYSNAKYLKIKVNLDLTITPLKVNQ